MNDRTAAYRCKVTGPQSAASLKLGMLNRKVEVVEQSRDSFTVRMPSSAAKRVAIGKKAKLFNQDILWSVVCRNKWTNSEGGIDVEFEAIQELTPPKFKRYSRYNEPVPVARTQPIDGTVAALALIVFTICLFIMPAWGGRWGTSQIICNAANTVWKAAMSMILGREYI